MIDLLTIRGRFEESYLLWFKCMNVCMYVCEIDVVLYLLAEGIRIE